VSADNTLCVVLYCLLCLSCQY